MRHVFVETNWVVDYAAPAHYQDADAVDLLARARLGEIQLYLPAVCLSEARYPLRSKFKPRQAGTLRDFLRWVVPQDAIVAEDAAATRRVVDRFEKAVKDGLENLDARLAALRQVPGLNVFAADEAMLSKAVDLSLAGVELKPFDQVILASVLVCATSLRAAGEKDIAFCDLDTDLQPWDKNGNVKPALAALYGNAGLRVYSDFLLQDSKWPPDGDR